MKIMRWISIPVAAVTAGVLYWAGMKWLGLAWVGLVVASYFIAKNKL